MLFVCLFVCCSATLSGLLHGALGRSGSWRPWRGSPRRVVARRSSPYCWTLDMIYTIDNADDDNVAYEDKRFTTTTTEHSFCLSCWSSWSCSSRDMIQTVRGREIAVAIPDIKCQEFNHAKWSSQPEKTKQSTKIWLKTGTSVLARAIRRASWSWAAKMRRPINSAIVTKKVHMVGEHSAFWITN